MTNKKLFAAVAAAILAILPGAGAASAQAGPTPELAIHFINVGQGDSTLITCPNGANILIDGGSLPSQAAFRAPLKTYVTRQILPRGGDIDYLIVTHPDNDHFNMLEFALNGIVVRRTYYVGTAGQYRHPTIFGWITNPVRRPVRLADTDFDPEATPNDNIDCGAADIWILAAAERSTQSPSNSMSIVVMVRMGDFEAILTGDATHATENAILGRYTPTFLDIDVLKVGHHGSVTTSTSREWANALSPRTAIVSAGLDSEHGHPRSEVTAHLTPHTIAAAAHPYRDSVSLGRRRYRWTTQTAFREDIYSTATNGNIVIRTSGTGYRVATNQ